MGFGGGLALALYLPLDNVDLGTGRDGDEEATNGDKFATDVDAKK